MNNVLQPPCAAFVLENRMEKQLKIIEQRVAKVFEERRQEVCLLIAERFYGNSWWTLYAE